MNSKAIVAILGAAFLFGCASPEKAELKSTDAKEAVLEIETLRSGLVNSNIDVLASKSYTKGHKDFEKAVAKIRDSKSEKDVLNLLSQAKAHFMNAKETAKTRQAVPDTALVARNSAIKAGAERALRPELKVVDKSLISKTKTFSKDLSVTEISEFQNRYLKLEGGAVQNQILGPFKTIISKARKDGAADLAPKTFRTARTDVQTAENLIRHSPRDPAQYKKSVDKSNKSAKLLSDVMNKLKGDAKGASEKVALTLVFQERKLGKLSSKVETLEGSLGETKTALGSASKNLRDKEALIMSAESKIKFQKAMNQVRKSFNEDEATVYQQGERLIIRLKKINFASGKATIPTNAMELLSKVSTIVNEVEPKEVVIEGHTDSMGQDGYNMTLSGKRAEAVKEYFSSLKVGYPVNSRGFGETRPLANNETKEGRALNRRVDIVVKAMK